MRLKILKLVIFSFILLPFIGKAQKISGVVKSKSTTISFDDFGFDDFSFHGDVHSNLVGSKYTLDLKSNDAYFKGLITDKLSKFIVEIDTKLGKIEGEIDRAPNGTKDYWELLVFGKQLNGTVVHNMMGTKDTYHLIYDAANIEGAITKDWGALAYDLKIGAKKITGKMKYNISTVKHSYSLTADQITKEEFLVLFFIEVIKLINEQISEIDEFQGND